MKFLTLVENTCLPGLNCAHGLSIYIETAKHKVLFDAGPDGDLLLSNAKKLGVDLSEVDIAIISHGHYDHAGGLSGFLSVNKSAKIFIHPLAYERRHFATENCGWRYIGPDIELLKANLNRIQFTSEHFNIDDELILFSEIISSDYLPESNSSLYEEIGKECVPDPFHHEQNLLINENNKCALFAGCAHRGIINIINSCKKLIGKYPEYVVSGFHLTNPGLKLDAPKELVYSVANVLNTYPCKYYTGHCTGTGPYNILKEILGDKINNLCSGTGATI